MSYRVILPVLLLLVGGWACGPKPADNGLAIKVNGSVPKQEVVFFRDFYEKMMKAVETEDSEASFSFYSGYFKGGSNLTAMKANISRLYEEFKDTVYIVQNVQLVVTGDAAVTEDEYTYSAFPKDPASGLKPLDLKGRERIYWIRENGVWKISEWIYY